MLLTWGLIHQTGFVWVSFSVYVSKCDHLWLQLTWQFPLYSGSFFSSWILNIKPNQHPENFPCVHQALFGLAHPLDCNLDGVIFFSEWIDPCESRLPDLIWLLSCSNEIWLVLFCFLLHGLLCLKESLKEAQLMVTDKHFLITTLYF